MFTSTEQFLADWRHESESTGRIMDALSDASLAQQVVPGDRSLGWTAWHLVTTLAEMPSITGLKLTTVAHDDPRPASAAAIAAAYKAAAAELAALVEATWTDDTLKVVDNAYGEAWPRGLTLAALIAHEIHHRGQMTVLMRQAGLRVPGVYGPAKEDWAALGMEPPAVN
jgi:uncharacterized damage-inducible protein DinB